MNPTEIAVLERLKKSNPLGWKPTGRDEYGHGVMETIQPAGPGKLKVCRMVLTPDGIVNAKPRVIDVEG